MNAVYRVAMWQNGHRVWSVELQDDRGRVIIDDTGMPEVSSPYPGNRAKTAREAKRLAKAHGVKAFYYSRERGYLPL